MHTHHSGAPRRRSLLASVVSLALVTAGAVTALATSASAAPVNLSQGKAVTASSTEDATYYPARYAVDGSTTTRWSSAWSDDQWIQVDLGQTATLDHVELAWEGAYGKAFGVQVSDNPTSGFTTVATVANGAGGNQSIAASGAGRYVRLALQTRATGYGFSLWELRVFGTPGTSPTSNPTTDPTTPSGCGTTNVALGRPASSSSVQAGTDYVAASAFDGKADTRWSSAPADGEWLQVDLGSSKSLCSVQLDWEGAYGKAVNVQASSSPTSGFTTIGAVANGTGGKQTVAVDGAGRYLRLQGVARGTGYGYSLWEVRVYEGSGGNPTPTPTNPTPTPTGPTVPGADPVNPDFGPNVHVFTPQMTQAQIQSVLDSTFTAQETAQFGTRRDQFLFLPGTYDVQAHIGFNTSINGVGRNPDDVDITGGVWVDAQWFDGNATQNFWRSAENFAVTPFTGEDRWAVAQAAPMRRVHIKGNLAVHSSAYGWASGGYLADSKVDGEVRAWTQQQWYTRDSAVGNWAGDLWNMVFSGVQGAPATTFPKPAVTTLANTGAIREKPYLYRENGRWAVFVPSLRSGTTGVTWPNTPGTSIGLDRFYLAKPGDSADRINQALAQGLNLLLTPGVYELDRTIAVDRADTVVLGLGYATIVPTKGQTAMRVGDVDGVKIGGVLFDAGVTNSPAMLQVGSAGNHTDRAANPVSIHDVFVRVGGRIPGKVTSAIVVNSDDTIVDHIWSWRADHGAGVGWTTNPADYGLVVNGNDVKGYGLFVEHYQKYNLLWNGENGRVVFFQNELPYDPPSTAAWTHDGIRGWAAYKVADSVNTHQAWGLGSYCVFTTDPSITVDNGFEVPVKPGVRLYSLSTVSLGGQGTYAHVVNGVGPQASGTATVPATVTSYGG